MWRLMILNLPCFLQTSSWAAFHRAEPLALLHVQDHVVQRWHLGKTPEMRKAVIVLIFSPPCANSWPIRHYHVNFRRFTTIQGTFITNFLAFLRIFCAHFSKPEKSTFVLTITLFAFLQDTKPSCTQNPPHAQHAFSAHAFLIHFCPYRDRDRSGLKGHVQKKHTGREGDFECKRVWCLAEMRKAFNS